jgi:hypothetical protein
MSIWVIAPVTDEPEAVLTLWCIFETDKDTRHFVGYDGRSSRVSSFIVEFDPKTRKGNDGVRSRLSASRPPAMATATRTTCGSVGVPHAESRSTKTCRNR